MSQVPCPHCTFMNVSSRVKCAMCLKLIKKRNRPSLEEDSSAESSSAQSDEHIDLQEKKSAPSHKREEYVTMDLFQTAAGKPVNVSKKSLAQASSKYTDDVTPSMETNELKEDKIALDLFHTATGKPVIVSRDSLIQASQKFPHVTAVDQLPAGVDDALEKNKAAENKSVLLDMFQTAAGKPVNVSKKSLEHATAKFSENAMIETLPADTNEQKKEIVTGNDSVVLDMFETAAGKPVNVAKASLAQAHAKYATSAPIDTAPTEALEQKKDSVVLDMFQIANGSPVLVSKKVLAATREKMEETRTDAGDANTSLPVDISMGANDAREGQGHSVVQSARLSSDTITTTTTKEQNNIGRLSCAANSRLPAGKSGSRRGFVPPRRAEYTDGCAPPAKRSLTEPRKYEEGPRISVSELKRPKFQPLEFNYQLLTSTSVEVPSKIEKIADVDSLFEFSKCSSRLSSLLLGTTTTTTTTPSGCITVEHWRHLLVSLGAVESSCPVSWCKHVVTSAVLQAYLLSVRAGFSFLSPTTIGLFACQKYNKEIVEGERPVLRKMTEGDVSTAAFSVLYLSSICQEQLAPHTKVVTLSDGFYHLKATLDIPLSNLIREGVLKVGQRLAVCGAKLRLSSFCSPSECTDEVCFALNYNCVRAVTGDARLGLCHHDPDPLCVRMIHPSGGMVPAIKGVVKRTLPPFFISQQKENNGGGKEGMPRVLRNRAAQYTYVDAEVKAGALAQVAESGEGPMVSKVTSVLLEDENGDEAMIQQWETCALLESTREDDGHAIPKEGSTIVVFALNPSKSNISAAPFPKAKQFNCSRSIQYSCLSVPATCTRLIASCAEEMAAVAMSCVVDFVGVLMELRKTDQGTLALFLLQDDTYALLQIPVASPSRVLSLGCPTAKGSVLFVLNGTFVSATDQTTGSDCARVFANEYTLISQRLQHLEMQKLSESLRQKLESTDLNGKKYVSRCEDILSSASTIPAKTRGSITGLSTDAPHHQPSSRAQGGENRLPYYLRADHEQKNRTTSLKGVVISTDVVAARVVHPPLEAHRQLFHFYGNIVGMKVLSAGAATILFTRDTVAERPPDSCKSGNSGDTSLEVTWRFGALPHEVLCAVIRDGKLLETICSPILSFEKIRSLIADDRYPEVGIKREEMLLTRYASRSNQSLWWALLTQSCAVAPHTPLDAISAIPWCPSEWVGLLKCIRERLRCSFYKFSLSEGELANVFFISDQCNIINLFE